MTTASMDGAMDNKTDAAARQDDELRRRRSAVVGALATALVAAYRRDRQPAEPENKPVVETR